MKLIDLSLDQARKEFGDRLVTLNTGKAGVRAGIHTTCKDVAGDAPVMAWSRNSAATASAHFVAW
jgi:hypothetical protein